MTLTPEEQALLDARREMLRAGDALDVAYAALRSAIATGANEEAIHEGFRGLATPAAHFDAACRANAAAFCAVHDKRKP